MQSFCDNFRKCEPVFIILSLLHSSLNCRRSYYIIRYLTSNLQVLPCEICMFNCTTLHNSYSIQKCDKSFIYSKYLQKCHVLDHMSVQVNLQYHSMCSNYLLSVCTHALHRAHHFVNECINDALLQYCAKRIAGNVTI